MDEKPTPRVGDKVEVRYRHRSPDEGTIVAIGPKFIHIETGRRRRKYYRYNHIATNDYGDSWFLTREEALLEEREQKAWKVIRPCGLQRDTGATIPIELLEALAETVRRHTEKHPDPVVQEREECATAVSEALSDLEASSGGYDPTTWASAIGRAQSTALRAIQSRGGA